ncbi:hypothetical protein ACSVIJ_02050 [Pseudomonas sp. NCHU5208]|uniref:hypothetical protein n=1 Tax=unclassified Pseudomonas TaxID=196821 RepID=UPI003F9C174F
MDYFIILVTTLAGLVFHSWLYLRIRRWVDRDLALSLAGTDADKRSFMLERLKVARRQKLPRKQLSAFLEQAAQDYEGGSATPGQTP